MTLLRGLGLDLVPRLEGAVQLRGLVHMETDFFPGRILHHVKVPVDPQQVSLDCLGAGRSHVTRRE